MANEQKFFDIPYGVASAGITTTAATVVATTEAYYHGMTLVASTTNCTVYIYDNSAAASGNIVDVFRVFAGNNTWIDRFLPVRAKNGITVSVTGTGAVGAIFYSPKG